MEGEEENNNNDKDTKHRCARAHISHVLMHQRGLCKGTVREREKGSESGQGLALRTGKLPTRNERGVERKSSRPDKSQSVPDAIKYPLPFKSME